jgi:hypothetical protein
MIKYKTQRTAGASHPSDTVRELFLLIQNLNIAEMA